MKYIIVIVLIILLLVFLLSRRKEKNSNKTSSNIILSAVNPTSCYDTKEECDALCKGYRCSDNCNRSTTQCQEGETGCYGSEETCKSTCTPVYRCNSVSGVVKEYKACVSESGCYTGESQANANCVKTYSCDSTNGCIASNTFGPLCATGATNCYNSQSACSTNCVKTYSCAGSGPTGPTGCNPSTFGLPCVTGATNCYNSSTSCIDACKGYRCLNCTIAGAKCDGSEPNCYPTSAACSTSTTCPMVYRCTDNCTASRSPCTIAEQGKCFTNIDDCKMLCSAKYKYNLTTNNCEEIYRNCNATETCYTSMDSCIQNSRGYRCNNNCVQSNIQCTDQEINDGTCYRNETACKTTCRGYMCGMTGDNIVCNQKINTSTTPNIHEPCTASQLLNQTCFITNNCLNKCDENVFSLIKTNPMLPYRIVNTYNNRQLSSLSDAELSQTKALYVSVRDGDPNYMNPNFFWLIVNGDWPSFFFVPNDHQNNRIGCPGDLKEKYCTTWYTHNANTAANIPWQKITIEPSSDPVEFSQGICYLRPIGTTQYFGLGKVDDRDRRMDDNEWGNGYRRPTPSETDPEYLVVKDTKDATTKWKIIPR
jgi:hypothetical protein